ncbi:MAG: 4-hydroxy-tetrahydrodipicolinate synthase [Actinobacteria bacterium]|nr:4-hydroxy-tetrahydrodipicolinate synthase [Actinomycetota bacterium]
MTTQPPFGRLSTAMVTPFKKDLSIDWDGVSTLAQHLLSTGHDAIIVNGTTGEAPTTSDDEKDQIIRVVKDAVAGKAKVVAGAGNNETTHSVEQALRAQKAGADGLLVVTPYYNKPPQPDTIVKLSEHPRIVALKDAKGDVASTSWVIKRCGIPVYSGDDILNLPLLSVGAVGFVSVCGHTVGKDLRELLDSWFAGNTQRALEIHQKLLPVFTGTFRTQGAILTKAALNLMGLPGGYTRLPLVDATDAQIAQLREDLRAGGVTLRS